MQEAPSSPPPSNDAPSTAPDEGPAPRSELEANLRAQQQPTEPDKPDEPKVPVPSAKVLAAHHRKAQEVWAKQQELAAQRKDYETREAELAKREAAIKAGKDSPADAIRAMGFEKIEDFLDLMAKTGGEITPEQRKLWELEKRLAEKDAKEAEWSKQREQEQAEQEYAQGIRQWHEGIRNHIDQSPRWAQSLVSLPQQERQVLEVLQQHHAQTGEQLDVDVAIEHVNAAFEQKMQRGLQELVANPRGRAMLDELVEKLSVGKRANVSKQAQTKPGLTPEARNHTERYPDPGELSLDEALQRNSRILREESRRL